MNTLITSALTILCLMIHSSTGQDPCTNYNNQPGRCVPIASCRSLFQIDQNPNKSFRDHLVVNGNICGRTGTTRASIKVCCVDPITGGVADRAPFGTIIIPSSNNPGVLVTTTTTTTTTSTTQRPVRQGQATTSTLPLPGSDACGRQYPSKIVGGSVAGLDEHPWLARLEYTYDNGLKGFHCAGSLINSRYVLTAAHCIRSSPPDNLTLTGVRLGEWNSATERDCIGVTCSDPPQDIAVEQIISHPNFNHESTDLQDDIALLRLAESATFSSYIQPICLPTTQELRTVDNFHGKPFEVSGWGATENLDESNIKLKVKITGVDLGTCNWIWRDALKNPISERQICAGGESGKDSCQGDSGGPLMSIHTDERGDNYFCASGIVSYGLGCGVRNWPGVYTNVARYLNWIEENVKP